MKKLFLLLAFTIGTLQNASASQEVEDKDNTQSSSTVGRMLTRAESEAVGRKVFEEFAREKARERDELEGDVKLAGSNLEGFPLELLLHVVECADWKSLVNLSATCRFLNRLTKEFICLSGDRTNLDNAIAHGNRREIIERLRVWDLSKDLGSIRQMSVTFDVPFFFPPNFKALNLSGHHGINFGGLPRGLEVLDLSNSPALQDENLEDLPRGLRVLNASHCINITADGLRNLPKSLQVLDVSQCRRITKKQVEELKRVRPNLTIICQ